MIFGFIISTSILTTILLFWIWNKNAGQEYEDD